MTKKDLETQILQLQQELEQAQRLIQVLVNQRNMAQNTVAELIARQG